MTYESQSIDSNSEQWLNYKSFKLLNQCQLFGINHIGINNLRVIVRVYW